MSEIPRFWRLKAQSLRLEGSNCPNCGVKHFPPRPVCPDCRFKKINGNEIKTNQEVVLQDNQKTNPKPQ